MGTAVVHVNTNVVDGIKKGTTLVGMVTDRSSQASACLTYRLPHAKAADLARAAAAANVSTATYVRLVLVNHLDGTPLAPPAKPKRKRVA